MRLRPPRAAGDDPHGAGADARSAPLAGEAELVGAPAMPWTASAVMVAVPARRAARRVSGTWVFMCCLLS